VLQGVAGCCRVLQGDLSSDIYKAVSLPLRKSRVAEGCSALQCVAERCIVI